MTSICTKWKHYDKLNFDELANAESIEVLADPHFYSLPLIACQLAATSFDCSTVPAAWWRPDWLVD